MELEIEGNATLMTVRILGALTVESVHLLRESMFELISSGRRQIRLDLAQMPFLDTSGIGALIGLRITLKHHKGSLEIINPQPTVLETLKIMRLDQSFGLDSTDRGNSTG